MTTLADLVFIDSTGYHYADFPTFLEWRTQQYKDIYGTDVYLEPDSQDGQLIAAQAQSDYDTAALGASVFNSFSPVTAQGAGLARNVKINGLNKRVATKSTVDVTVVGQGGTLITNGIAIDALNQKWLLPVSITIPGPGTITVTAEAENLGAVTALPNTINQIFTPTRGWQTVNNDEAATLGAPVEQDGQLRARQAISTANPSKTVLDGSNGAVGNIDGVTAVRSYENDDDVDDANGIPPHSICTVVAGGDSQEVAEVIALHKTPGAGTFGTTSEEVVDAHGMPLNISFSRPVVATIGVEITLSAGPAYTSEYEPLIKAAVANVVNGFGIGNDVLLTKLYGPAYLNGTAAGMTYDLALIRLKKDAGSFGTSNITIDFDEQPFCDPDVDVTIIVT